MLLSIFSFLSLFSQNPKLEPGQLHAASGFENRIPLHWENSVYPAEAYKVFRKTAETEYQLIAQVPVGTWTYATFIDRYVDTGTEYSYVIKNQNNEIITNESSATCNHTGHNIIIPAYQTSPAIINGVQDADEWSDAERIDISPTANIFGTGDMTESSYAYYKKSGDFLYIAIEDYNNTGLDDNDQFTLFFDFNNDNAWSENDGRYAVAWFNNDIHTVWDDLSGQYPDVSLSNTENQPDEITVAAADNGNYLFYEIAIDLNSWHINLSDNDFAMLIQTSVYTFTGDNEGTSGMFPPAAVWKAPETFSDCAFANQEDTEAPILNEVSGLTALIGEEMEIVLKLSDFSEITSVNADYTIGGDTYNITFNPAKISNGFSATLPAQNEQTTGSIVFNYSDEHGNSASSASYDILWTGDSQAPEINWLSAPEIATPGNLPIVSANITDNLSGISSVDLVYSINGQADQTSEMSYNSNIWSASLPDGIAGDYAEYQILAYDGAGNMLETESILLVWYDGGWYGAKNTEYTGNNFGSQNGLLFGIVLQLGNFTGKINKLAYMVPSYCLSNWSWQIVDIEIDENGVNWTNTPLTPIQTYTEPMVYDVDTWTEININSDTELSGDVGLIIQMQPESYWGRDAGSTQNLSWFYNTNISEWEQLGTGGASEFPGDFTLKAHLYGEENGTKTEKVFGNDNSVYCFPNPCNQQTNIQFNKPVTGNLKLTLFDSTGKEIQVLLQDEELSKGNYTISVNTANLKAGTYFYRIVSGKEKASGSFIKK